MTPLSSTKKLHSEQLACQEAWNEAMRSRGSKRCSLIAAAFPHSISISKCTIDSHLKVSYSEKFESYVVSDHEGFLTLIEVGDLDTLLHAIVIESKRKGTFREEVTGKEAPKPPNLIPPPRKEKINLEDLDLANLDDWKLTVIF